MDLDFIRVRSQPDPETGCWIWQRATGSHGYGQLKVAGRYLRAHRLSYELAHGEIPPGLLVMHACDVRACVNPEHLSVGTHDDNMADMARKGRGFNPSQKLTQEQVNEIRRLRPLHTLAQLSDQFGVAASTVSRIASGVRWGVA